MGSAERIGERVRSERVRRGLTQFDLAVKSGVSASAISKVERGDAMPSVDVAARLARALDMSLAELVGEESPPAVEDLLRRLISAKWPGADYDEVLDFVRSFAELPADKRRTILSMAQYFEHEEHSAPDNASERGRKSSRRPLTGTGEK